MSDDEDEEIEEGDMSGGEEYAELVRLKLVVRVKSVC